MVPASRTSRLVALALGLLLALGAIALVGFSSTADALPAATAAPLAFTTPTPSVTGTPTPTATPIPGFPQMTDIVCNPTLTADNATVDLLDRVTFTFDAGCECTGDFACDFFPWNATLSSGGVALLEPFGNPPPTSFTTTAVGAGEIEITVNYFGEKQVGSFYFTSQLSATTQVTVIPIPSITPTPTATPDVSAAVVCTPSLTASNDTPVVGEEVTFTFESNCTCPTNRNVPCYFAMYSRDWVTGDGFDFSEVQLGSAARGTPIVGIATAAGSTEVTVQWYGETYNGSQYHWTYLRPSVTVNVLPTGGVADFSCEHEGAVLNWNEAGASKYWIYRTTPDDPTETWIGRTLGATTFTDPNPVAGAAYLVHFAGISRTPCEDLGGSVDPAPALTCSADAGVISWNDVGESKYWVYRSTLAGAPFAWLGRTLGATEFIDPNPIVGATYQVRFAGAAPFECALISEPADHQPVFACTVADDTITWTDHGEPKYWIYRSTDGGLTYTWLGRALGTTTFTDPNPIAGAQYQVHYAGIPRVDCGPVV